MLSPFELEQSKRVHAKTLSPRQHRAMRPFRIATSYWLAPLLKLPGKHVGEFHSFPEYLNGGLAEGDAEITLFIPQPYDLLYRGKRYKPDALEVRFGKEVVVELKPRGEFDEGKAQALSAFLKIHNKSFEVRSNDVPVANTWQAINWYSIIQQLILYKDLDTEETERELLHQWPSTKISTLSDWVDPGDRDGSMEREAALFRLCYRGWIKPKFDDGPLDYDTQFVLCPDGAQQ